MRTYYRHPPLELHEQIERLVEVLAQYTGLAEAQRAEADARERATDRNDRVNLLDVANDLERQAERAEAEALAAC